MSTLRSPLRGYQHRDAFRCCILSVRPSFLEEIWTHADSFSSSLSDGEFPSDHDDASLVAWPCRRAPAALDRTMPTCSRHCDFLLHRRAPPAVYCDPWFAPVVGTTYRRDCAAIRYLRSLYRGARRSLPWVASKSRCREIGTKRDIQWSPTPMFELFASRV